MKELFLSYLEVSLSGSVVIGLILLFRIVFRKAPKGLICVFWLVAMLRLLLPFQLESPWSMQPKPVDFTNQTQVQFTEIKDVGTTENDPGRPDTYEGQITQKTDDVALATVVWCVVGCALGVYALISYLTLKHRVREACRVGKGIYVSNRLDTAFVIGYLRPRIYLPQMDSGMMDLVLAHEREHIKRGDNWLKLLGYLCLCLHWYNPLVWLSYVLLCTDVENACDEQVIRKLDVQGRKDYSAVLLACGKEGGLPRECPVAFGEISIKQRIQRVLHYRKPALWLCVLLVIVIVLTCVFFLTDPLKKHPPCYEELISSLGQPLSVVCEKLGIAQSALERDAGGVYRTPLQVEYCGVAFDLHLMTVIETDLLAGFEYVAEYEGQLDRTAQDGASIANHLYRVHRKGIQAQEMENPKRLFDITEETLDEILNSERSPCFTAEWDITNSAGGNVEQFLAELEASDQFQMLYGNSFQTNYMLYFEVYSEPEQNSSMIILRYKSSVFRGSSVDMMADLTEPTTVMPEQAEDVLISDFKSGVPDAVIYDILYGDLDQNGMDDAVILFTSEKEGISGGVAVCRDCLVPDYAWERTGLLVGGNYSFCRDSSLSYENNTPVISFYLQDSNDRTIHKCKVEYSYDHGVKGTNFKVIYPA